MFENKLNKKKYIGQSVNIERRYLEHIYYPSPHSKIDKYIQRLGTNEFDFIVLEECKIEELDSKEKYWIEFYNSIEEGYNLIPGGQSYRGEENLRAKLSDKEVLNIIKLLEAHKLNNRQIAEIYGVSNNTIDNINRCKNWTHLHKYKTNIRQENLNKLNIKHSSSAGENCPTAKITEEQAIKIINALSSSEFKSLAQTSRDLNTTIDIITDINRCRTWKYLHNYTKNIRDEAREKRLKGADII